MMSTNLALPQHIHRYSSDCKETGRTVGLLFEPPTWMTIDGSERDLYSIERGVNTALTTNGNPNVSNITDALSRWVLVGSAFFVNATGTVTSNVDRSARLISTLDA